MAPEFSCNNSVPEGRIGRVHDWGEMSSFLPTDVVIENKRFLRGYFKAQLLLNQGNKVKAGKLFNVLDKAAGYPDFEESNHNLLKIIDMAVRGQSRWQF